MPIHIIIRTKPQWSFLTFNIIFSWRQRSKMESCLYSPGGSTCCRDLCRLREPANDTAYVHDVWEWMGELNFFYKSTIINQVLHNVNKCYISSFTRSKNYILFNYIYSNGVPLQRDDEIHDLGVIITTSLSGNNHIDNIISKTAGIGGSIKRTLEWHASFQTKDIMYSSLARPLLDYFTVVWSMIRYVLILITAW